MPLNNQHLQPSASGTSTMQWCKQSAVSTLCADRAAASQSDGSSTRHVVVADASLPDLHILLAQLPPDTQVFLIHEDFDALGQIAQAVSHCHNLQGLHILGHGQPGRMLLGEQWVDAQTIARAGEHMAALGAALAADAHIWLYGCHSAAGSMGEQWLDAWAQATGVAVHGSADVWPIQGARLDLPHRHQMHNPLNSLWLGSGWIHTLAANSAPTFFIGTGKVVVDFGPGEDEGRSVIRQADGKLVVAGGGNNGFSLVRLNADGSLDSGFGTAGKLVMPLGNSVPAGTKDIGYSVIQQSDGKLVVAGASASGGTYDFSLIRLNVNGSLDGGFGTGGKLLIPVGSSYDVGYSVIQQADGKLVVAGSSYNGKDRDFSLVRLNANGTLDTSFSGDGKLLVPVGIGDNEAYNVIQQTDGKLVLAGSSYISSGTPLASTIVRVNADGALDTSFSGDGKLERFAGVAYSVIQQTDGKLMVAGTRFYGGDSYFSMERLNGNGTVDTSFAGNNNLLWRTGEAYSAIQQGDGKLVLAGWIFGSESRDFGILRLNTDGRVDTSFDGDGKLLVPIGSFDTGRSVIQLTGGKLLVAGTSDGSFSLVQLNSDGTLDTRFNAVTTNTLGGTVAYTEHAAAAVMDADVVLYDENLSLGGSGYGGANATLARNGGANPQDVFTAKPGGTLGALIEGGALVVSGTNIGTVTTNSGGILKLTFNDNAINVVSQLGAPLDQSLVNSALQQIAYKNDSLWQNTSIQIDWTFSDGNTGAQGTGGALTATGNVTVNVTATNDLLVLNPSASPTLPTITEYSTNPAGISVAGLVVDGSIFDDDKPNPVEAIVIEAVDTRVGTWQFSLDGGATWLTIQADLINSTTNTLGLGLGPTALIRLLPFGNLSQTATSSITFRAWDQSDGNSSGSYFIFNPPTVGGLTPVRSVSLASDVATASVLAVNEGPNSVPPNGIGKVIVPTAIDDSARSVVVQPDGKIVMAGLAYTGIDWDFAVTRLNANGSLDSSFGSGGKATFGVGVGDDWGQTILARPDGKFVVAGYAINGVTDYFAVAQLNADGSLDTSFGTGGKAVVALGKADRTLHQYLYTGQIAALQPDGKIVLGGSYNLNGAANGYDFAVARLNTDGSVDNSFGLNGIAFVPVLNGNDLGQAVLVMPNGDIMVAGSSGTGTDFNFSTVRVNSSGNLVSKSSTGLGRGNDYGTSFAAQTDGKIVMAGRVLAGSGEELAFSGIDDDYGIVRFLANGQLDTGFGIGGQGRCANGPFQWRGLWGGFAA